MLKKNSLKRPKVTLKFAQSIDGRIACVTGDSQWISSAESRKFAHKLRAQHDAVLVGINTVLTDNPKLTVRHVKGKNPKRVIIDTNLRIPINAAIVSNLDKDKVIIVCSRSAFALRRKKVKELESKGLKILCIKKNRDKSIDIEKMLISLKDLKIKKLFVEGGSKIITSFLKSGFVDKLIIAQAPLIIGAGIPSVRDLGIKKITKAYKIDIKNVEKKGKDYIFFAEIKQ
ncbi:RibD family protein [bacterium]